MPVRCHGIFLSNTKMLPQCSYHGGESRLLQDELSTDAANQVLRMLGIGVFRANSTKLTATQLQ